MTFNGEGIVEVVVVVVVVVVIVVVVVVVVIVVVVLRVVVVVVTVVVMVVRVVVIVVTVVVDTFGGIGLSTELVGGLYILLKLPLRILIPVMRSKIIKIKIIFKGGFEACRNVAGAPFKSASLSVDRCLGIFTWKII